METEFEKPFNPAGEINFICCGVEVQKFNDGKLFCSKCLKKYKIVNGI